MAKNWGGRLGLWGREIGVGKGPQNSTESGLERARRRGSGPPSRVVAGEGGEGPCRAFLRGCQGGWGPAPQDPKDQKTPGTFKIPGPQRAPGPGTPTTPKPLKELQDSLEPPEPSNLPALPPYRGARAPEEGQSSQARGGPNLGWRLPPYRGVEFLN